jgi:hypothetical protein
MYSKSNNSAALARFFYIEKRKTYWERAMNMKHMFYF